MSRPDFGTIGSTVSACEAVVQYLKPYLEATGPGADRVIGTSAGAVLAARMLGGQAGFEADQTLTAGIKAALERAAHTHVQIIQALGPAAAGALAGGILQKVMKPGAQQVSESEVAQLSPAEVTQVVDAAQAQKPEISQQLSDFYAQHSGLLKALGSVALLAAAIKMKQYSEKH